MFSWSKAKNVLGYILAFALIVSTFIAVQSQSYFDEEPSAEGRLSQYYGLQRMGYTSSNDPYPGDKYPIDPGEEPQIYPGDEKWDGQYIDASRLYPTDVQTLVTDGQDIYAGGDNLPVYPYEPTSFSLARWKNNQWERIASGTEGIVQGKVYGVVINKANLYAGGTITQAGSLPVKNVAFWDGATWHDMNGGVYQDTALGDVACITSSSDGVYVGGWFTHAGSQVVHNIARWDGQQWHDVGGGVNGDVKAIAVNGNDVYVGGSFSAAGSLPVNNIARWDGQQWHSLGAGASGMVLSIVVQGNDIYVGGDFGSAGGQVVNNIARWDGNQWFPLGDGLWNRVKTIRISQDGLYAGGYFAKVIGQYSAYNIAFWDGLKWSNLGSGIDYGYVSDILPLNSQVLVGGRFQRAGNNLSGGFAIWNTEPQAMVYQLGDTQAAPGSIIYLYGKYFTADRLVKLYINGTLAASNLKSDPDGKVYVRLVTSKVIAEGQYKFIFIAGDEAAPGIFKIDQKAGVYTTGWSGTDVYYPIPTIFLPLIRR